MNEKIHLLVVDDHTVVRKGLCSLLSEEKYGIEVVGEAVDGVEAIDVPYAGIIEFKTLQGQEIKVDGLMWHINKKVKVNDAKTIKTDIQATNGVIHAIDSVLMPK